MPKYRVRLYQQHSRECAIEVEATDADTATQIGEDQLEGDTDLLHWDEPILEFDGVEDTELVPDDEPEADPPPRKKTQTK